MDQDFEQNETAESVWNNVVLKQEGKKIKTGREKNKNIYIWKEKTIQMSLYDFFLFRSIRSIGGGKNGKENNSLAVGVV